jgi:hypothetical protein
MEINNLVSTIQIQEDTFYVPTLWALDLPLLPTACSFFCGLYSTIPVKRHQGDRVSSLHSF